MSSDCRWTRGGVTTLCALLMTGMASFAQSGNAQTPSNGKARARVELSQALPKLDGGRLKVTLVEVNYGPGESSPPHSHPCAVVGYVVEGALRTQVKGETERIYRAGESFYEAPHGVHAVSANASTTEPARFVAYFVCDHEGPLSIEVPAAEAKGQ